MKIVSIANLKGGAGKTTCSAIAAAECSINHNLKCLILEADDQGSLTDIRKMDLRNPLFEGITPPYDIIRIESDKIDSFLIEEREALLKYDLVFIELPGYFNDKIVAALRLCDCILMPVVPNLTDKASLIRYVNLIQKAVVQYKIDNDYEFIYFAVQNKFQSNKVEHKLFKPFLTEILGLDVFDTEIRSLEVYANKLQTMVSYTDTKYYKEYGSIKEEVNSFIKEFKEKFEL